MYRTYCPRNDENRSNAAPHGPRLALSKVSMCINGLDSRNQSHFIWLMPLSGSAPSGQSTRKSKTNSIDLPTFSDRQHDSSLHDSCENGDPRVD